MLNQATYSTTASSSCVRVRQTLPRRARSGRERAQYSATQDPRLENTSRGTRQASTLSKTSQCCDDPLNSSSTPQGRSAASAADSRCANRWDAPASAGLSPSGVIVVMAAGARVLVAPGLGLRACRRGSGRASAAVGGRCGRPRADRTEVALGRAAHDRLAVARNDPPPPGADDPLELVRLERGHDPADRIRSERDQVRVAVHEADPGPVGITWTMSPESSAFCVPQCKT